MIAIMKDPVVLNLILHVKCTEVL